MHILVLSPHRNDAAFSLGLAMEGWLAARDRVTVLNVFSRSTFAPFSDADTIHSNDLLGYVSGMRRKEDGELQKLLPKLRFEDLNLKDAPIRLRCTADEAYGLIPRTDDSSIAKIRTAVGKLDSTAKFDAVILPLGLGHHVDHLVVRDAALVFASSRAYAFYEDLPDALGSDHSGGDQNLIEDSVRAELTAVDRELTPAVSLRRDGEEMSVQRKLKLISGYASQIDRSTMQGIARFSSRYGGGERLWVSPSWPL